MCMSSAELYSNFAYFSFTYLVPFGFKLIWHLRFVICVFLFFFFFLFFFCSARMSTMNSASEHCSRVPQITPFGNFFIKNGSHGTIYTFKNYFTTVFSVSVFSFSKNKLYPNGPLIYYMLV